ncbi:hypothetical protein GC207_13525 [bacterium]|nr:hypothetical protein [bacterium]
MLRTNKPSVSTHTVDFAEQVMACEHIAALAVLLEEFRPDGCPMINGTEVRAILGRLIGAEARKLLHGFRQRNLGKTTPVR